MHLFTRYVGIASIVVSLLMLAGPTAAREDASPNDSPEQQTRSAPDDTLDSSPGRGTDLEHPYRRSEILMWTAMGLGVTHHVDHVLRDNHSGFPFRPEVNEFTYSLGIYPLLLTGYFLDAGPNYWILTESLAFVGLGLAHTLIEPPSHQHDPWAHGTNRAGVESHATGRGAQTISVLLSVGVGAHLVSSIVDGVQCGFTWKKRGDCGASNRQARFVVSPTSSGMKANVSWRW